jgi:hypothetical protein
VAVLPTGQPVALASEQFGARRHGSGYLLLENSPQSSPTFLPSFHFQPKKNGEPIRQVKSKGLLSAGKSHQAFVQLLPKI